MIIRRFCAGPPFANTYVVADQHPGEAIVIDPGGEVGPMLDYLRVHCLTLVAIVNTHGHFDHVGGNRALRDNTGAPIMMHRADARLASAASGIALLVSRSVENSPPPDRCLEEGDEIRFGSAIFRAMHTPGHTPGGISLSGPGVVFCGDLIVDGKPGRSPFPGCSERLLLESIGSRILALPDAFVLHPGHGRETTIGKLGADPQFAIFRKPR